MDSTSLWSTPRRELRETQVSAIPDYSEGTGMTPTPTNEPVENTSPSMTSKSPIAALNSIPKTSATPLKPSTGTSTTGSSSGRPCLAGTQTIRHQASFHHTPARIGTDLLNTSALSDYTHDSSGFGSLMTEQNSTQLSGYPRSAERPLNQYHWPIHNLISLESDTSDISLDQSSMQESNQAQSPIVRTEYPVLGTAAKNTDLRVQSPLLSGLSKLDDNALGESEISFHTASDVSQQTMSGRQSRMLEENLASVARYVEELTGCGSNTGTVQSKSTKSDLMRTQQQKQSTLPPPLMSGDLQEQRRDVVACGETGYVSPNGITGGTSRRVQHNNQSLLQIQQLNQHLSDLVSASASVSKSERVNEKELLNTAAQELLRRLLANQLPGLVDNATSQSGELKAESEDWSSIGTEGLISRSLLNSIQQQQQRSNTPNKVGTSNADVSGNSVRQIPDSLNHVTSHVVTHASNSTSHMDFPRGIGGSIGNLKPVPDLAQTGRSNTTSALDPTLLNNVLGLLESLQSPTTNTSSALTSNTVALLASLLTNGQSYPPNSNQQSGTITSSALLALLSSLQASRDQPNGPRPLFNREVQRRSPSAVIGRSQDVVGGGLNAGQMASPNVPRPMANLMEELHRLAVPYQQLLASLEPDIERAANVYRNSASTIAQKSEAAYHWSGKLPVRVYRSMTFSRKVFLGGVPWDSTSEDLIMAFSRFGNVTVSWPQKDGGHSQQGNLRHVAPKGYCYLIFEHESSVADLLAACVRDPTNGGDYYRISGSEFKSKNVQVIPWVISDSQYTKSGPYRPDTKRTVFIGALHGMITAEALVTIMNDLFGNVVFAALDTDRYKYPIGSGRVAFSSHKSYMRAVTANFVDVRTSKFTKTIQIDPYLEDAYCDSCYSNPGIYFCRAFDCFRYFCPSCWQLWHNSTETLLTHKPLRRTFKPFTDMHWTNPAKY